MNQPYNEAMNRLFDKDKEVKVMVTNEDRQRAINQVLERKNECKN